MYAMTKGTMSDTQAIALSVYREEDALYMVSEESKSVEEG